MAASSNPPDANVLIDQLQAEVNRVLEQTGRIFAAHAKGGKPASLAQATKLRLSMPQAGDRFHSALDQLDDEIQLAKLVMRRDLAVSREMARQPQPAITNGASPGDVKEQQNVQPASDDQQPASAEDVTMEDAKPDPPPAATPLKDSPVHDGKAPKPDSTTPTATTTNSTQQSQDSKSQPEQPAWEPVQDQATTAQPPATQPTPNEAGSVAELPNDDGPDFDDLFADPPTTNADPNAPLDFSLDAPLTDAPDFDFDFNAPSTNPAATNDNDNISALLPGLQDYANTGPAAGESGKPDFEALLAGDGGMAGGDGVFDDLMDFGIGTGEFGNGQGGNGGGNAGDDFDFSFD